MRTVIKRTFYLLLLSFLLIASILGYIFFQHMKFYHSPNSTSSQKTIGIVTSDQLLGEYDRTLKTANSANAIGVNAYIFFIPKPKLARTNFIANKLHQAYVWLFQPDAVLVVAPNLDNRYRYQSVHTLAPEYVYITDKTEGTAKFLKRDSTSLQKPLNRGYLDGTTDLAWLKKQTLTLNHHQPTYIEAYPSSSLSPLTTKSTKGVFYCGANWDPYRSSDEHFKVLNSITHTFPLEVYGPKNSWRKLSHLYKGSLPFDGKSIQHKTKELGISLVFHGSHHLDHGVPTSRIFEAASVGSVIICDEHPFVKKYFGDTVYYINTRQPFNKVINDMSIILTSIRNNPQQALDKGKKARQIFENNFTLEKQLHIILQHAKKQKILP